MREAPVGFQCPDDAKNSGVRRPRTAVGAPVRQGRPLVTFSLIGLNVLAYLATALQPPANLNSPVRSQLFADWTMWPIEVHAEHQYYRMLTGAFMHLSLTHIAVNMLSLFIIGPPLERLLGRARFLTVYLLAALGGSVAVYAFGAPLGAVAGASGAIFGLFAAALVFARRLGLDMTWLVGTIAVNFVFTFTIPGISELGHVGGFVTGALSCLALAGWPPNHKRVANHTQLAGLVAVAVLLVVITVLRSAMQMTIS
jgi:membrane associated rhomboid family serine protease